ncbi:hypothetical protein GQ607_012198 [Colletotrichum asianum]|uniref:Uncharacterized protein n=1 Tax=Colletotrichum asianum TaxID=702518 RepID=A0A8H3ZM56_9PEZI|nr:hypothetical protein GQ607_012198 [Colletotrichum asianum]
MDFEGPLSRIASRWWGFRTSHPGAHPVSVYPRFQLNIHGTSSESRFVERPPFHWSSPDGKINLFLRM